MLPDHAQHVDVRRLGLALAVARVGKAGYLPVGRMLGAIGYPAHARSYRLLLASPCLGEAELHHRVALLAAHQIAQGDRPARGGLGLCPLVSPLVWVRCLVWDRVVSIRADECDLHT